MDSSPSASKPKAQACWQRRGCDEEMLAGCPHNTPGEPCPADCHFAACYRDNHVVAVDLDILLNPDRDYEAAQREVCRFCEFFLIHGPSIADRPPDAPRRAQPNRFIL